MIKAVRQLKKFEGKGGWTYAEVPEIKQDKSMPFGWVQVSAKIDGVLLNQIKLMPMGDKEALFFPVKAALRKQLGKQAGDWVEIELWPDDSHPIVPDDIVACLELASSEEQQAFEALADTKKRSLLNWINEAKTDATRSTRIAKMLASLSV